MKQIYKYNPKIQARSLCAFFALLMVMTFGASCNKDFPNTLKTNYKNDTLGIHVKSQKVLYIIVDGMRGGALKTLNTPNISKILSHSVYTYDGLSDFDGVNTTNAGGWTNMLTGVSRSKHNVVTEDFAGNDIAGFPTLFTRLKQLGENELRTASFSASTTFSANLATDAVENKVFQNDDLSVKNAANEELKNPQAAVVLAHFQDVEKAGKENSYSAEDPVYAAAITQMDSYIGELLGNLVKRPTYNTENWLVVIASNKGGVLPPDPLSTDKTMFSDLNRNTFIVFYNPRFNSQILPKPNTDNVPFTGNGIRVRASASYAVVPDDGGLYNFGSSGDYTVQLKFKTKSPITTSWPAFFSKKAGALESIVGWYMYCEGNSWTVILKGANGASSLNSGSKNDQ